LEGRPDEAEDACHEALLRASQALPRFREGAPLWPWLATIAANVCKDLTRNDRRYGEIDADTADPGAAVEEVVARRDRASILLAAMGTVPLHYRKALYLREFEEWSWEDIAKAEGKSVASVRSTLTRARQSLRSSVRQEAERVNQWPLPGLAPRAWAKPWSGMRDRLDRWYSSSPERMLAVLPVPVADWLGGMIAGSGAALGGAAVAALAAVASLQGPSVSPSRPEVPPGEGRVVFTASAEVEIGGGVSSSREVRVGVPGSARDWWFERDPLVKVPVGDGNVSVVTNPASWGAERDADGNTDYAAPGYAVLVIPPSETGVERTQYADNTVTFHCRTAARSTPPFEQTCSALDLTAQG
jgi:RNA polymerase sigma-70 factor (ECF subfamily)